MAQNLQGKKELVIEAKIQSIVKTILDNCKNESESKSLHFPLEDYEDRAAYYTGLQKKAIYTLLDSKPLESMVYSCNSEQLVTIMKKLLQFYQKKQLPKYKDVFETVQDVLPFANIEQFRYAMISMGFNYRKTGNGFMIAEDAKLAFERFNYLKKMKKMRANKLVPHCYLEERYIDKTLNFAKPDFAKDVYSGGNDNTHLQEGFYLYHALSDSGLDNYLITNKICKNEYRKWVFEVLLKVIHPGCTIIFDNHPLHGELEDDSVTPYHSKADMLNWLRKRNIPCSDSMFKAELYEIISKCLTPQPSYDFDRLLKAHGYEVLRLPIGFSSPTHEFWGEVSKVSKQVPLLPDKCSSVELQEAIIPVILKTHEAFWKQMKLKVSYSETALENLYAETEAALENYEPFDVKNVDLHANIPLYFHVSCSND